MGFKCGIVGLPNVGKSTLFNALTQTAAAQAANYPFCTIEPNVGDVAVPDPRLEKLAAIASSKEIVPTRLTFVDIAGLVRGASKGEGLGNQFLANIRECDAIAHVVRCFEDGDVTHVEGRIDPISDIATIETELMLADLESLERRVVAMEKKAKGGDKEARSCLRSPSAASPNCAKAGRRAPPGSAARSTRLFQSLGLLSSKPVLYVCNVEEAAADKGNAFSDQVRDVAAKEGAVAVVVSAKIESEIAILPADEQKDYLEAVGLAEPGLNRVIRAGYALLHLVTFFTVGPKEARAWTVEKGAKAPQAAGVIHTDFEKGFIRAETIAYDDYVACKGEAGAREAGKFRLEGKDYVVAGRRRAALPLRDLRRPAMSLLYFEDFPPGEVVEYGDLLVTAEDIVAFAREFDPQPFHLSHDEGLASAAGGLIASGWHTAAMMMRINCDEMLLDAASQGSPGIEAIDWRKPVRPGDRLRVRRTTLSARASRSRPDLGVVEARFELINQNREVVMTQQGSMFFRRRPSAEAAR